MKKLIVLMAFISINASAFHLRCHGPNDMEILISASSRDVVETNSGVEVEEAHIDFRQSKSSKYQSGWGELKIEDGLTVFNGKHINLSYKPYNPVEKNQNSLLINGEMIFENIDLSCSAKF
jgi:hypothetical protein